MIYYLGKREDNIILFNSDVNEFKKLDINSFFNLLCDKSYLDIFNILESNEAIESKIKTLYSLLIKNKFPLSNYKELCECLVYDKECKYYLETISSLYMCVATADLDTDIELRLNNSSIILNAESYWMTWPESDTYNYGSEICCSAFSYICPLTETYLEAKVELKDFVNTGISEALSRSQVLGTDDGCIESKYLPGLLSWRFDKGEGDYDEIEIPDGVNVIEPGCIPDGVSIKKLIYPESVLFILPNSVSANVEVHDMRKCNVTSLYNIVNRNHSFVQYMKIIYLPKCLKELNWFNHNYATVYLYKDCERIRFVNCGMLVIEEGSNLYYLGNNSIYKYIMTDDMDNLDKKVSGLFNLELNKLRYIEPDTFERPNSVYYYGDGGKICVTGLNWPLSDVNYSLKKKLKRVTNVELTLNESSNAYEILKDLPYVKLMEEYF